MARKADRVIGSTGEQVVLLEELKALARQLGFDVREEKLLREVGYRVRSGSCRVRGSRLILLDRSLPYSGQIDVLVDELAREKYDEVYLSPLLRSLLERAGAGRRPSARASE